MLYKNLLVIFTLLIVGLIMALVGIYIRHTALPERPGESGPPPVRRPVTLPEKTEGVDTILEGAHEKGLAWLMGKQLANGAWPDLENKPDVAFTALALISAQPSYQEKYQSQIDQGVKYLLDHQQINGSILEPDKIPSFAMYKTPLAIVALVSIDKGKYQEAILKARGYLESGQYRDKDQKEYWGGWGYKEGGSEVTPNPNMSTTSYVIEALRQADLPQESATWKNALEFLQRCQDSSEYNDFRIVGNSGGFVYSPTESKAEEKLTLPNGTQVLKPYGSMTYAGLMSFIYAFVDKDDPRVQSTYHWLRTHYTLEENPGLRTDMKPHLGKQGLFYYYHTLSKALDAYGAKTIVTLPDKVEHFWATDLVRKLAALQHPDGTWSNEESRWWEDFPALATCYSLMTLNICRKWVNPVRDK